MVAVVSAATAVSWIKSYGQTLAGPIHQRHREKASAKKAIEMGVVPLSLSHYFIH